MKTSTTGVCVLLLISTCLKTIRLYGETFSISSLVHWTHCEY